MTKFVDLHLCAPIKDIEKLKKMVTKSYQMGYRLAGIPLPTNVELDKVETLRKICSNVGLDFVSRVDLNPRNIPELLTNLRRVRRKFEVVAVLCTSKPVARQAAKDRRVDVLSLDLGKVRYRFFDRAEAELAAQSSCSLEIEMAPLLSLEGAPRIHLISNLRREVAIASSFRVPITVSSGATDDFVLRSPYDYSALAMLFDMTSSSALAALSSVPLRVVERNRRKLSLDFVAPGLHVVRRKDP